MRIFHTRHLSGLLPGWVLILALAVGLSLSSGVLTFAETHEAPPKTDVETPGEPKTKVEPGLEPVPNAIERVIEAGLMSGYPDGSFQPQGLLSRAELAHILVKTFRLDTRTPRITGEIKMQDVPREHWAYDDIQTVLRTHIMKGYREDVFHPNQRVTRGEAFAIMAQAYGVFSFDEEMVAEELAPYPDADQVPAWARQAMATALHEGFVNTGEMANRIYPQQMMTRGDMAYALNRYLERLSGKNKTQLPVEVF